MKEYDLVIIGGGSAGLTAAGFAVQLGSSVALVEEHRIGGDCTWTGCVPSKTLLKAARVAHQMRNADRHGLVAADPKVDLKAVMYHVQEVIAEIYEEESPDALRAEGIDVYLERGHFLDPHVLAIGEDKVRGRNFVIATGAQPFIPTIIGIQAIDYLTYETVWDLDTLPDHLLILGAGPVGCELAQAFCRLGAQVTLISSQHRILPRDDPDASRALAQAFEAEGIDLKYRFRADRAWKTEEGILLTAGESKISGDALLLATGRRPNLGGLDLHKTGIDYSEDGVQVDENLRTSQRHIYAAGDCVGGLQFTHLAGWQGFLAVRNALLPGSSKAITDLVPWTTFTDPEVAHIGLTEEQARASHGSEVVTCEWPMAQVDRARADGNTSGFVKLIHMRNGTLLGTTIVAERAGDMIHEWIVALNHGLKVHDLAGSIHIYPTYSTASMQAAAAVRVEQLLSGTTGRVVRGLARLMR
jgi:pyruvate/2-oxoglutarate dehydrogenase complex dihydrolipoamide dehydrogenase (E3) component